jgi:hypothetical protein
MIRLLPAAHYQDYFQLHGEEKNFGHVRQWKYFVIEDLEMTLKRGEGYLGWLWKFCRAESSPMGWKMTEFLVTPWQDQDLAEHVRHVSKDLVPHSILILELIRFIRNKIFETHSKRVEISLPRALAHAGLVGVAHLGSLRFVKERYNSMISYSKGSAFSTSRGSFLEMTIDGYRIAKGKTTFLPQL